MTHVVALFRLSCDERPQKDKRQICIHLFISLSLPSHVRIPGWRVTISAMNRMNRFFFVRLFSVFVYFKLWTTLIMLRDRAWCIGNQCFPWGVIDKTKQHTTTTTSTHRPINSIQLYLYRHSYIQAKHFQSMMGCWPVKKRELRWKMDLGYV